MSDAHQKKSKKKLTEWLTKRFKHLPKDRQELMALIKETQNSKLIDVDTFDMIEGVLEISDFRVRDIMIPRNQMILVKLNDSLDECLDIIFENGHSRYPVISEDRDHIEGILMAKDLLVYMKKDANEFNLKDILRPAVVIPEGKKVDQMLKEFRQQRYHIAIAIDEFGGVSGLLTIEDILELIVGEIDDEYDAIQDNEIVQTSSNQFTVSALTDIDNFNDYFHTEFSDDEVDTIGGLVMQQFGRLPKKGETTTIRNMEFTVKLADRRRIILLNLTLLDDKT